MSDSAYARAGVDQAGAAVRALVDVLAGISTGALAPRSGPEGLR